MPWCAVSTSVILVRHGCANARVELGVIGRHGDFILSNTSEFRLVWGHASLLLAPTGYKLQKEREYGRTVQHCGGLKGGRPEPIVQTNNLASSHCEDDEQRTCESIEGSHFLPYDNSSNLRSLAWSPVQPVLSVRPRPVAGRRHANNPCASGLQHAMLNHHLTPQLTTVAQTRTLHWKWRHLH